MKAGGVGQGAVNVGLGAGGVNVGAKASGMEVEAEAGIRAGTGTTELEAVLVPAAVSTFDRVLGSSLSCSTLCAAAAAAARRRSDRATGRGWRRWLGGIG